MGGEDQGPLTTEKVFIEGKGYVYKQFIALLPADVQKEFKEKVARVGVTMTDVVKDAVSEFNKDPEGWKKHWLEKQ